MLVVVGGHSRNIGKTSVMCALIAAQRDAAWQAFKITQHGHGLCNDDGEACGCEPGDAAHPFAIDEQRVADGTDSGRYLAAGARRAWWVRTAQGELGYAIPELRRLFAGADNNIAESNSLLRFLRPDLYIVVADFSVADIKDSSRQAMDRADAFVVTGGGPVWPGIPPRWFEGKPVFPMPSPDPAPEGLVQLVQTRRLAAPR